MVYENYKNLANSCANYEEADQLIKTIADDERISAKQYCNLRHIAIKSAYEAQL